VAAVYTGHPDVQAIILGGSVARGTAHERSDIDLGIFWSPIAGQEERHELVRRVGGKIHRHVDNDIRYSEDNPRRQGCIEIVELLPTPAASRMRLDLEHETVAGTENVLQQVIKGHDPSLEKQELISVIQDGIALHGHDLVARWRERTRRYADELVYKMVAQNLLGTGRILQSQVHRASTQDWFCLYGSFLEVGRRLLLALMALNRTWAYTDNPNFGGFKPVVEGLALKPKRFVERLGQGLQSEALLGVQGFADLYADVLSLVEEHLPDLDTSGEREPLERLDPQIAQVTEPSTWSW
jgi:hypothetical protein